MEHSGKICEYCGAPIFTDRKWSSPTITPVYYTCDCRKRHGINQKSNSDPYSHLLINLDKEGDGGVGNENG